MCMGAGFDMFISGTCPINLKGVSNLNGQRRCLALTLTPHSCHGKALTLVIRVEALCGLHHVSIWTVCRGLGARFCQKATNNCTSGALPSDIRRLQLDLRC